MISYTFDHARSASRVMKTLVSSDCPEILRLAAGAGFDTIQRPPELATADASVQDVMIHALDRFEAHSAVRVDALVVLYGNVPVRADGAIDRAILTLRETGCDSVRSFSPVGKWHPAWMASLAGDRVLPLQRGSIHRRQDLTELFLHDGGVVAVTRAALARGRMAPGDPHAFFGIDRRGFVVETGSTVEIDHLRDLYWARGGSARPPGTDADGFMNSFKIDQCEIGDGCRPFVIAEIGVNHDGSVHRALQLVSAAAGAGADAVKLQIFRANSLLHASASLAAYQKNAGADTPADLLRKYELSAEDIRRVVGRIRELKMVPLATPFSPTDLEIIEAMRLPAVKIASPDIVNRPLLEMAAATRKPLLISTGAATIEEIRTTVQWLTDWKTTFALLHCVSAYPTETKDVNLCWIDELWHEFGGVVGYSDHSTNLLSGALAVAAGATILERHLTYDRAAKGPDHAASSDSDTAGALRAHGARGAGVPRHTR